MKKMSVTEFEAFVAKSNWNREHSDKFCDYKNDDDEDCFDGFVSKTSELDGVKIRYVEFFAGNYSDADAFEIYRANCDLDGNEIRDGFMISGISVFDENGNELRTSELSKYLNSNFTKLDYSRIRAELEERTIRVNVFH